MVLTKPQPFSTRQSVSVFFTKLLWMHEILHHPIDFDHCHLSTRSARFPFAEAKGVLRPFGGRQHLLRLGRQLQRDVKEPHVGALLQEQPHLSRIRWMKPGEYRDKMDETL